MFVQISICCVLKWADNEEITLCRTASQVSSAPDKPDVLKLTHKNILITLVIMFVFVNP